MAPPSSQSSTSSPSLKRKQATISSFFTQKPSPTPKNLVRPEIPPSEKILPTRATSSPQGSVSEPNHEIPGQEDDEEEEDAIVRPAKRARSNRLKPVDNVVESLAQTSQPSQPQPSSSQRTDIFKFQSSPAVAPTNNGGDDPDEAMRREEKERLHQKFVKKLGGPDCLIGIGRSMTSDPTGGAAEAEEDEEDDEPAPPTKGKGAAKKGGSKLTPMEKQVIEIKRKHMDTVLVIEVGYKFRFFGEDARIAAKELGIVCIPGKMRFDERELILSSN